MDIRFSLKGAEVQDARIIPGQDGKKDFVAMRVRFSEKVGDNYVDRQIEVRANGVTAAGNEALLKRVKSGQIGRFSEVKLSGTMRFNRQKVKTEGGKTRGILVPRFDALSVGVVRPTPEVAKQAAEKNVARLDKLVESTGISLPDVSDEAKPRHNTPYSRMTFEGRGEVALPPRADQDREMLGVKESKTGREYLAGVFKVWSPGADGGQDHYHRVTGPANEYLKNAIENGTLGPMAEMSFAGQVNFHEETAVTEDGKEFKVLGAYFNAQNLDVVKFTPKAELAAALAMEERETAYQAAIDANAERDAAPAAEAGPADPDPELPTEEDLENDIPF